MDLFMAVMVQTMHVIPCYKIYNVRVEALKDMAYSAINM